MGLRCRKENNYKQQSSDSIIFVNSALKLCSDESVVRLYTETVLQQNADMMPSLKWRKKQYSELILSAL